MVDPALGERAWPAIYHLAGFARGRLRRRNPGPLPFSSMNSTPANYFGRLGLPLPAIRALQGDFDKMQGKPTQFLPESHCAPRPWMGFSLKQSAGRR
jgi:hypothetical protein